MTQQNYRTIDLFELWKIIWQAKLSIIFFTLIAAIFSVMFALSLPDKFKAETVIISQNGEQEGGLAAMAGQLGGIASIAGLDLGNSGDNTLINIERIKSKEFIFMLINKYKMKIPLIAVKEWNKETQELLIDPEIYDGSSNKWVRTVEPNRSVVPTDFEVYEKFIENLSVSQDKVTGIITIEYEYLSPIIAKEWVDAIIKEINQSLRLEKIEESEKSISYLEKQLIKTNVTEMRNVFYNLIQEQTKSMLLAEVQVDYAFKVIDSAIIPEVKSSPKRAIICVVGTLAGFFLSLLSVLLFHFVSRSLNEK